MNDNLEELESKVRGFLEAQPGFELYKNEPLRAFCEDPQYLGVIFGDDLQAGIGGLGEDVDKTYNDFVRSWNELQGFQWLKQNKMIN
jgi:hypothetical protein